MMIDTSIRENALIKFGNIADFPLHIYLPRSQKPVGAFDLYPTDFLLRMALFGPTGSGKTLMLSHTIRELLKQNLRAGTKSHPKIGSLVISTGHLLDYAFMQNPHHEEFIQYCALITPSHEDKVRTHKRHNFENNAKARYQKIKFNPLYLPEFEKRGLLRKDVSDKITELICSSMDKTITITEKLFLNTTILNALSQKPTNENYITAREITEELSKQKNNTAFMFLELLTPLAVVLSPHKEAQTNVGNLIKSGACVFMGYDIFDHITKDSHLSLHEFEKRLLMKSFIEYATNNDPKRILLINDVNNTVNNDFSIEKNNKILPMHYITTSNAPMELVENNNSFFSQEYITISRGQEHSKTFEISIPPQFVSHYTIKMCDSENEL